MFIFDDFGNEDFPPIKSYRKSPKLIIHLGRCALVCGITNGKGLTMSEAIFLVLLMTLLLI